MIYEYKTLRIKVNTKKFSYQSIEPEEIDKATNELGMLGWKLINVSLTAIGGTASEFYLFFMREKQSLEEMV